MTSHRESFRFHLDAKSGVPFYRQILEAVLLAVSDGRLAPGDQLPTSRQAAVDLAVNPNTVVRAYKELEIRGVVTTQQGVGTFISHRRPDLGEVERERRLDALVSEFLARAGALGFRTEQVVATVAERGGGRSKGGEG